MYITRESMELMGGIGYIEDQIMPKLMRDIMVLPIWEGAGNIMTLDMLRASVKSKGINVMFKEIEDAAISDSNNFLTRQLKEIKSRFKELLTLEQDDREVKASFLFEDLTHIYQMVIITKDLDSKNKYRIEPTLSFLEASLSNNKGKTHKLLSEKEVDSLIGWDI